jgi:hypothetical protein
MNTTDWITGARPVRAGLYQRLFGADDGRPVWAHWDGRYWMTGSMDKTSAIVYGKNREVSSSQHIATPWRGITAAESLRQKLSRQRVGFMEEAEMQAAYNRVLAAPITPPPERPITDTDFACSVRIVLKYLKQQGL